MNNEKKLINITLNIASSFMPTGDNVCRVTIQNNTHHCKIISVFPPLGGTFTFSIPHKHKEETS